MTRRRRPRLTVLTRPDLMSAHIVVLPTPTSLQAVFTGTANGFTSSGASRGTAVQWIVISLVTPNHPSEWRRVGTDTSDCERALYVSLFVVCRHFVGVLSSGPFTRNLH